MTESKKREKEQQRQKSKGNKVKWHRPRQMKPSSVNLKPLLFEAVMTRVKRVKPNALCVMQ